MIDSATPIIEYSIGLAQEFQARMSRMSIFVKDHNQSLGSSKETILRDFLSQHAPGSHHVSQGFIFDLVDPRPGYTVSKQCDILIYNQVDFPSVYADGPIKVVYPDSVNMVIEVKTHFGKKETKDAFNNIIAAKQLKQRFSGVIFAFNSPKIETVIKNIKEYSPLPSGFAPVAILLFDKGIIIHCWNHDLSLVVIGCLHLLWSTQSWLTRRMGVLLLLPSFYYYFSRPLLIL